MAGASRPTAASAARSAAAPDAEPQPATAIPTCGRAPATSTSSPCRATASPSRSWSACSPRWPPTKGRKSLILVSEGFIYDPNLDEFKERHPGLAARQRGHLLPRHARPRRACPLLHGASSGPPSTTQDIGRRLRGQPAGGRRARSRWPPTAAASSVKNTNDLGRGHPAHRRRVAQLLPARLQPDEHRARRPLPQDRRSRCRARRASQVRARKGYYAPLRGQDAPAEEAEAAPTPTSRPPSTRPTTTQDDPAAHDGLRLRRDAAGQGQRRSWRPTWTSREFAFEEKDGPLRGHPGVPAGGRPPRDRRVLPLRPEDRHEAACRPRGSGWPQTGSRSCATSSWRPAATRPRSSCATRTAARIGTVIHEFEVPDLAPVPRLDPGHHATPCSRDQEDEGRAAARAHGAAHLRAGGHAATRQFEVYGAAKEKPTGMPKVTRGLRRAAAGRRRRSSRSRPRASTRRRWASSRAWWARACPPTPPASYELVLSVKDEISGKTLEVAEPFTVAAGAVKAAVPPTGE